MQLAIRSVERAGARQMRGPGHTARMAIPPENISEHSPFLVMAEDWFAPPAGFPTHPHRGIETVTLVLGGQLQHEDHTGGSGRLEVGDAQFMTAGRGVMHSEMPGERGVHTLQLWLNLPARLKRAPAGYRDVRAASAPVFQSEGVEARIYAGGLSDVVVPHRSTWPLTMIDLRLENRAVLDAPVPAVNRAFAYVLEGAVALGADERIAEAGEVGWATVSEKEAVLRARAIEPARLLLLASPVIDEPVVIGGPFVMNTREEILEAYADLRAGRLTAVS